MALPTASPASMGTLALPTSMKSKSCLRHVALLVIVAGIAIGAVVYIAISQKPSSNIDNKCNGANVDGMYEYSGSDDSCLSTSKDSKLELLHDVGIFPSIASDKTIRIQSGTFQMYAKYTSDDVKNVLSVAMSVQMMTSSGGEDEQIINTLLQEEDSGDSSSLFICFTNNLAVLQMHYIDGTIDTESVYMQTEYGFVLKQNCIQYTKDKISLKSKSTSNVVDLPSSFHLEEYGAALLILSNEKDVDSSPRAYFLLGNIIYDISFQVSSYPTYDTKLIETTEEYDITGNIIVKGLVKVHREREPNDNVIVDVPMLTFQKIRMEPMPPGLRLYLTKRSNIMRVNKEDDIFVPIQEEAEDANQPPGSFSVLGTFGQEWIHSNPRVDLRDYADGYWYLWCEKFTVTLAYGSLDLKSDANIA